MHDPGTGCVLTIVIVSHNVADQLTECLASLRQAAPGLAVSTIVVDNYSTDHTRQTVAARFPEVRLVSNERNLGFAAANNQGLVFSNSPYVVLLNPDTVVRPGALLRLHEAMQTDPKIGILGPRITNPDGSLQTGPLSFPTIGSLLGMRLPRRSRATSGFLEADWVLGACMMVRREVIDEIGPMDDGYFLYSEEKDWCFRAKRAGWRISVLMDAEVVHLGGQSTNQCAPQSYMHLVNSHVRFLAKFYPTWYASAYLLTTLCHAGAMAGVARLLSIAAGRCRRDSWDRRARTYAAGRQAAWRHLLLQARRPS